MKKETLMPHRYEGTTHTRQIGSIQDFVTSGFNEDTGVYYTVLGDGHGTGGVVTKARRYKGWSALGELPNVNIQTLVQPFIDMTSGIETSGDGMTLLIVRCIPDTQSGDTIAELAWIGDSFVTVAQTTGPLHHTQHLFFNDEYVVHPVHQSSITYEPVNTFQVISDTEMRLKPTSTSRFTGKLWARKPST